MFIELRDGHLLNVNNVNRIFVDKTGVQFYLSGEYRPVTLDFGTKDDAKKAYDRIRGLLFGQANQVYWSNAK